MSVEQDDLIEIDLKAVIVIDPKKYQLISF